MGVYGPPPRPIGAGPEVLVEQWGSAGIVRRKRSHAADELPALVTEEIGEGCSLANHPADGAETDLVTLDAFHQDGIGNALLMAAACADRSAVLHLALADDHAGGAGDRNLSLLNEPREGLDRRGETRGSRSRGVLVGGSS